MKNLLLLLAGLSTYSAWAQNDCATAMPVTPGPIYTVTALDGAVPVPDCLNQSGTVTAGEWFTYTPDADTLLIITSDVAQSTGVDTRFHVYTGDCGSLVCVEGDDDSGTGNTSMVTMNVTAGVRYTIAFDNRWSSAGFGFRLILAVPPSPGSECSTAIPVTEGVWTVDSITGTLPTPNCLGGLPTASHGEWYKYTATADTAMMITTDLPQNAGGDTRVQVYTGGCNFLNCAGGDDDGGSGLLSTAIINVTAGVTYYIAFDDNWSADGFDFQISLVAPIPLPISFTQVPNPAGGALGVVDMNGDHLDDIVYPSTGGTSVSIAYQHDDHTLVNTVLSTPAADHTASWSFCAGDIDHNGYTDMMYGGASGATFMFANSDGTGFTETSFAEYIFCQRTNMVDIDNDGDLDAFSCHDVDANVYFTNDGTGALTFHQGGLGPTCGNYGSLWVDYDNDHDQDLFIAKCGCDPVDLFMRNDGNLSFVSIAAENGFADSQQSWSSAWGDFDNDGDMDVLVGSSAGTNHKLMRNDGGTFTNVTVGSGVDAFMGSSIEWTTHDFDNDGYLDVLGGGGMLMNNGDMTFTAIDIDQGNGPIGDLNDDGFLDIVNNTQLFLNNGNANHWLSVSTVGTTSNADGIGARVEITSAMGTQIRDIRSGDGFKYMSSLNAHFGLAADSVVNDVTVYWPSGEISLLHDVTADQHIVIVEGLSTAVNEAAPADGLVLFPNPVENTLYVRGAKDLNNRSVRITDLSGKLVRRGVLRGSLLDVQDLARGLYLLHVDGEPTLMGRFIKQ